MQGLNLHRALSLAVHDAHQHVKLYMYKTSTSVTQGPFNYSRYDMRLETQLWSTLPNSSFTSDPQEADFFVVQQATQANMPLSQQKRGLQRYLHQVLNPYFMRILYGSPFYNRSYGRDHLIAYANDLGPECDCLLLSLLADRALHTMRSMFSNMSRVGYFGQKGGVCGWRNGVDIAVPMFNDYHRRPQPKWPWEHLQTQNSQQQWASPNISRKEHMHFQGNFNPYTSICRLLGIAPPTGFLGNDGCSNGTRLWLKGYLDACGSRCSSNEMGSAWYSFAPAGNGCWSARLFDAIDRLVVPIIIASPMVLPFSSVLDYSRFSVALDGAALQAGNVAPLDELHRKVDEFESSACYVPRRQGAISSAIRPECEAFELVKMIRSLAEVRQWLHFKAGVLHSATGLLLIELHARKVQTA